MSGPSEKAVEAAVGAYRDGPIWSSGAAAIPRLLNAAHDPALGLDRSVCLRDVVEFLQDLSHVGGVEHGAHEVARKFGGRA